MQSIWILTIVLVLAIFTVGCIGPPASSTPVVTPTPQIVYVTVLVTPTPTASTAPVSSATYSSQSLSSSSTHFSGDGDDVKSFTAAGSGLRIFTMHHNGDRNFIVWLKNSRGEYVALLVNEIGSYYGKKSERLTSGTYYLDITADGAWTIDISSM
jgi:hypothetical protein